MLLEISNNDLMLQIKDERPDFGKPGKYNFVIRCGEMFVFPFIPSPTVKSKNISVKLKEENVG